MGPNGSGKSTLSYVLSGKGGYEVTDGTAQLEGVDILDMEAEERAAAGLFSSFSISRRNSWRGKHDVFAHSRERPAQIAWRRGNERRRIS